MKFLAAMLATGALASTVRRQAAEIPAALEAIGEASTALGVAVDAYQGEDDEFDALETAHAAALASIASAIEVVEGAESIEAGEAIALTGPIGALTEALESTVDTLIEKQPIFEENDDDDDVLEALEAQAAASAELSAAINSRLPEALQPIGEESSQPIADALQRGIDAFADAADDDEEAAAPTAIDSVTFSVPMFTETPIETISVVTTITGSFTTAIANTTAVQTPAPPAPTYSAPPEYTGGASAPVVGFFTLIAAALVAAF